MPDDDTLYTLQNELKRTRQQLWIQAVVFTVLLVSCAAMAVLELRGSKYADRFIVRDDRGRERAVFGIDDSGNFGVYLKDAQGGQRAALFAYPEGNTVLGMSSSQGDPRAVLITHDDGSVELNLRDREGKTRVTVHGVNQSKRRLA